MSEQKDGLAQDESARGLVVDECIAAIREHYGFSDDEKSIAVAVLDALKPSMATLTPAEGEEAVYDRSNTVPVAWIAFAANGNVRFWTADEQRAKDEKARGMDMRAFTLAELMALVSRLGHAEAQVEDVDAWLAKAADQLNVTPIMKAMDLGNEITQWRLARQKHTSTVYQPEPAGFCPCCNGIATKYPDGRRTCVRCEWEEAATTNSPHERKASTDV